MLAGSWRLASTPTRTQRPLLPNTAARRLRIPGYLVMALMIVQPLVELYIRSAPFRIHSPAWRLTLVGNATGAVSASIVGLFFMLAIAVLAEDKPVTYVVSSVSALAAVLCIGATGLFALDALQMRSQVQANLAESYGLASGWVAVKLILSVVALGVLAISALRGGAEGAARPKAASSGKSSVLIGASRPTV